MGECRLPLGARGWKQGLGLLPSPWLSPGVAYVLLVLWMITLCYVIAGRLGG